MALLLIQKKKKKKKKVDCGLWPDPLNTKLINIPELQLTHCVYYWIPTLLNLQGDAQDPETS